MFQARIEKVRTVVPLVTHMEVPVDTIVMFPLAEEVDMVLELSVVVVGGAVVMVIDGEEVVEEMTLEEVLGTRGVQPGKV